MVLGILQRLVSSQPSPQLCSNCQQEPANPVKTRCQHVFDRACYNLRLQADPSCPICSEALFEVHVSAETHEGCLQRILALFARALNGIYLSESWTG
jgi:hypothetical protein